MAFSEEEIIVLIDEDGEEKEFEIVEIFELDDSQYAFLYPVDDQEEEAIIMKIIIDEDNEEVLVDIEDDEEWTRVLETWEGIIEELDELEREFEEEDEN